MDLVNTLAAHPAVGNLLSSVAVVAVAIVSYRLAASRIRKVEWHSAEIGRRWVVMIRNITILVAVFSLFVLWAEQLRTLAFSLVGFAVAIGLVTKELAMCLTGGMLRSSSGMFDIGHRIEIDDIRGDVVDMKMLTTTILEIGPERRTHMYTGRAVVLPNSVFLSEPVVNESYTRDYVLQTTIVPLKREADWERAETHLLRAAEEVCEEFIDAARDQIQRLARREGIEVPPIEPRVTVNLAEPGEIHLILRFPTPARRKGRTEQAILRRYLALEAEAGARDGGGEDDRA